MRMLLQRLHHATDCTIGSLSIAGSFECWTLEDPTRPDGVKIFGETAIPTGLYSVDITYSPRFKRPLPLLVNVKGFVGIRIHPGNDAGDTEGCILVGMDRERSRIGRSRLAFEALFAKIQLASLNHDPVELRIVD